MAVPICAWLSQTTVSASAASWAGSCECVQHAATPAPDSCACVAVTALTALHMFTTAASLEAARLAGAFEAKRIALGCAARHVNTPTQ